MNSLLATWNKRIVVLLFAHSQPFFLVFIHKTNITTYVLDVNTTQQQGSRPVAES